MALTLRHLRGLVPQTSIGLDLGRSADGTYMVHAVGVRGHGIRWRQSATLDADSDLATTLGTFLRALPRRWVPRPSVVVAIGPASIQLKRLPRLPSLTDSRALTSLVRENVSRFFVRNGVPLMTSALRVDAPGDAWGAAVERPLLDAVARACAIAKMRVTRIVPAATVLGYALAQPAVHQKDPGSTDPGTQPPTRAPAPDTPRPPGTTIVAAVEWADGPATYLLHYDTGRLVKTRRAERRDGGSTHVHTPADLIAALGPNGWPFAAAYTAAIAGRREPIGWRCPSPTQAADKSRARLRPAIAICAMAGTAAVMSVPIGASFATARASRHVRAIAAVRSHATRAVDSLKQVTTLLEDAAAFANARHVLTPFLAALTTALPSQTALTSIHIDTAGGTLVALTPNAAAFVKRLEQVPGLAAPELTGPVTSRPVLLPRPAASGSASSSPVTLSEVTVRFRLTPVPAPSTSRSTFAHTRGKS